MTHSFRARGAQNGFRITELNVSGGPDLRRLTASWEGVTSPQGPCPCGGELGGPSTGSPRARRLESPPDFELKLKGERGTVSSWGCTAASDVSGCLPHSCKVRGAQGGGVALT